jgi:hypothetical protein
MISRKCRIADTVSAQLVTSPHSLHVVLATQASCDFADTLVASGTWVISRCGQCRESGEKCVCPPSGSQEASCRR